MATSGTYSYAPSIGELSLAAFERCGMVGEKVTTSHLLSAQREWNLWFSSISNDGPNLWTVDQVTQVLVAGTGSYSVDPSTVMILDVWIDTGSPPQSQMLSALSRSTWAAIAGKQDQGRPTSFWFDRTIAPTVQLWPVPDSIQTYTLRYYRYRQVQDGALASGQQPQLPYLFLDAAVSEIAARMARIYAVDRYDRLRADATTAWALATTQNTENAPMTILPQLGGYYR